MQPEESRIVSPGPRPGTVRLDGGRIVKPPAGWELLPPGDAGLTRRVKKSCPTWTVKEKRGRRELSRGVWAPADVIARHRADLDAERETDAYKKRRAGDRARRERKQAAYVGEFTDAVRAFLDFPLTYDGLARRLAAAVATHATPVGSGTVARTERIPVERRAEAAVIAWLRHHTTAYDHMKIPRVRGKRREVRRMLAERGRELLDAYRRGDPVDSATCPLARALEDTGGAGQSTSP